MNQKELDWLSQVIGEKYRIRIREKINPKGQDVEDIVLETGKELMDGKMFINGEKIEDILSERSDLQAKNKDLEGQIEKLNKEFEAYRNAMTFDID